MLKNKLISAGLVAAGLLLSAAASAQVYVGGTVGKAKWNNDCSGTSTCSTNANTYKLLGGYNINNTFAVEGSYYSLGTIDASYRDATTSATGSLKAKAFELAGIAKYDFTNELTGFAKLGVASVKTEGSASANVAGLGSFAGSGSTTSTQPVFGLGLTYKLTKELALRGEFETRKVKFGDDKSAVNNLSVGLQYAF
ncbi:outer membrane beta-barrel protein [Undibacterium rugosum]|uniref:outer membrane beta-barrel protein n=1 Tax=Undibacterium rugosum TaxID=2762291 RepID=UPI001B82DE2C|nr:outer membrane beta-barrel protein [Undibacterium rugosum]MBR7776938.1 outer membrane beta-barrel protein [Undibacterium rugosum]